MWNNDFNGEINFYMWKNIWNSNFTFSETQESAFSCEISMHKGLKYDILAYLCI
jgi:hypothetical protein